MTQFWLLRPMWKAGGEVFWESVYFLDKKEERHPSDNPYNIKLQPPLCPKLYFLYSNPTLFLFHTTYGLWTYYMFVYCLSPPIKMHPREKRCCVLLTTISQCRQPCLANCDPLIHVYRMNECSYLGYSFSFLLWMRNWWLKWSHPPWDYEAGASQENRRTVLSRQMQTRDTQLWGLSLDKKMNPYLFQTQ